MKKQDLKYGNVVELRKGYKLFYHQFCEGALLDFDGNSYIQLDDFDENLKNLYSLDCDIVKVYEDYTCTKLLLERKEKPELTEDEKTILRNLPKEYKYIARDKNGDLCIYSNPIEKDRIIWRVYSKYEDSISFEITVFGHLFQFVKWEDEEAYLISDLLGE